MSQHGFCRTLLIQARKEAAKHRVDVPKCMRAIRSTKRVWWVEAIGMPGQYISADCAYDAKAKLIGKLIEEKTDGKVHS